MKIKNVLVTVLATLAFVPALESTTQAATWHKGVPRIFWGKWKSPAPEFHTSNIMIIGKTYVNNGVMEPQIYKQAKYKYISKHVYKIYGENPVYGSRSSIYLKFYNHNKIGTNYSHVHQKYNIYHRY